MAEPMPGPWEWGTTGLTHVRGVWTSNDLFPDESRVADVHGRSPEEAEANARLVASSPDLLAVAQQWLDWWNSPRGIGMAGPTCDVLVATESAIAKARGSRDKVDPTTL